MIIDRVQHPGWLANSWLLAGREEARGLLVDVGADPPKILEMVRRRAVRVIGIICTHRHYVHTAGLEFLARNLQAPVYAHPLEKPHIAAATESVEDGHEFKFSDWTARVLHVPGHTAGQLAISVENYGLWSADTLFKGSVGATIHPGSTGFDQLRHSVLERLLNFPAETSIYPGHGETTTVGHELERNPFVRVWRGVDAPSTRPGRVDGKRVTVEVWARDYDGSHKAQVRGADGHVDIVPGSKVQKVSL
ncbi:MAG: MBL fold metallo-hydrolase [Acidobacteria bacterium]|nr:MBL fold metallo-hydrolase [Acidobacteriota bacterium]